MKMVILLAGCLKISCKYELVAKQPDHNHVISGLGQYDDLFRSEAVFNQLVVN